MAKRVPLVAIVGRPNVGKSTLFNRLVGGRHAIVEDTPGVTRDRLYARCEYDGEIIELVDTGGFEVGRTDDMLVNVRDQAKIAIEQADIVIWLCNARDDVTAAEEAIADVLRAADKPILIAANKCDVPSIDMDAMAFYSLGFESVRPVSAAHGRGIGELLDEVLELLRAADGFADLDDDEALGEDEIAELQQQRGGHVQRVRMCIVGRPNVGKSTLANALLGKKRMLASDIPGTTRDAIDADFEHDGETFTLIDTAGMRRPARITESIEQYAVSRAVRAIERSHIAVLVLDATQALADQDARIASLVERRGRACVVVVNKWDAVEKDTRTMRAYEKDLDEALPFLAHAPRIFVSALKGQRVHKVMNTVLQAYAAFNSLINTSKLNRWLADTVALKQPPVHRGKRIKLYFGSQTQTRPPRFEFQCNIDKPPPASFQRFMARRLRDTFDLYGTPIRLGFKRKAARRARGRRDGHDHDDGFIDETGFEDAVMIDLDADEAPNYVQSDDAE